MVGGYLFALSPSLLLWLIMACNVAMVLIYFLLAYGVTMLQASRMAASQVMESIDDVEDQERLEQTPLITNRRSSPQRLALSK